MAGAHKAQEGASGWMKPQWVRYKLDETIEKSCSGLLASHQRKYDYAWPAWQNGDLVTRK
jgi:hypothetical protein